MLAVFTTPYRTGLQPLAAFIATPYAAATIPGVAGMSSVRILTPTRRIEVARFATVGEAAAWRWHRGLDAGHPIIDGRDLEDPDRQRELPLIAGLTLREALEPLWRNCQYDRLADRAISRLPDIPSDGLEAASSLLTAACLAHAGVIGWSAWAGHFRTMRRSPIRLSTDVQVPRPHSWCAGPQGILDISAGLFRRMPVTFLPLGEDVICDFHPDDRISDSRALDLAGLWMERIGPEIVDTLLRAGIDRMNLDHDALDMAWNDTSKVPDAQDDIEGWQVPEI